MLNNKILNYITYQTFPAETANSQQTISNLKYLSRKDITVKLFFPLREKSSNAELIALQNFYEFNEKFEVNGVKHNYPFGKINIFNKIFFHISHFLWAKYFFKNYKPQENEYILTRSDWILYFSAVSKRNVVFECHQTSKLRNLIIRKLRNHENVKYIFLNENLEQKYSYINNQSIVLHNAVDSELFVENVEKEKGSVVFVGSLERFGKLRGFEIVLNSIKKLNISNRFNIKIIGGPNKLSGFLDKEIKNLKLENYITAEGRKSRASTIKSIQNAEIGLLINENTNKHSIYFTSPLKYFEYLYGGLKIVATDNPAHRKLPYSEDIFFYDENDEKSFEKAMIDASKSNIIDKREYKDITLEQRSERLLSFIF